MTKQELDVIYKLLPKDIQGEDWPRVKSSDVTNQSVKQILATKILVGQPYKYKTPDGFDWLIKVALPYDSVKDFIENKEQYADNDQKVINKISYLA